MTEMPALLLVASALNSLLVATPSPPSAPATTRSHVVPATMALPWVAFDPIEIARDRLEDGGKPPPTGYTIRAARDGELSRDDLAHTDSDAKVIVVDLRKCANFVANTDGDPEAYINLVMAILDHEYGHTETYGVPSPDPGGFSNDICSHMDLYELGVDALCDRIRAIKAQGGRIGTLCRQHANWVRLYNSNLGDRNRQCPPPPKSKLYGCVHCE